jgi:hypothetical protein
VNWRLHPDRALEHEEQVTYYEERRGSTYGLTLVANLDRHHLGPTRDDCLRIYGSAPANQRWAHWMYAGSDNDLECKRRRDVDCNLQWKGVSLHWSFYREEFRRLQLCASAVVEAGI